MPSAANYKSSEFVKLLYIGDSGTGKTTSLASLVAAGYQLRVLDFDNLLDSLIATVRRADPGTLNAIHYGSYRDRMRATPNGPIIDGQPRAFIDALKAIDVWEDKSIPAKWGTNHILVIDSLTMMAKAAYWWAKGLQGAATIAEGVSMRGVRPEQFYHTAQQALLNLLSYVTASSFETNVIIIAHIKYIERDGITKGFPVAVGNAISPEIPSYFPSVALATKSGTKRIIKTRSTAMIDLKNPRSFEAADEYDMDDGLARFFKVLLG